MKKLRIGAAAVVALAPLALAAAPAQACGGCDDGDITVRVSDTTPASGQQFIARGKLTMGGLPAADHVVRVQTFRGGEWVAISGARVTTNEDGKYRVRLILSMKGKRVLRVVGVGQGDEPTERQRFTVRVH
jgi:hypothetical protein